MTTHQLLNPELAEEIDLAVETLARNLKAVMNGGGHPELIVDQIRDAADALRDFRNLEAEDPDPAGMVARLRQLGGESDQAE